jgi:hypothetical protein
LKHEVVERKMWPNPADKPVERRLLATSVSGDRVDDAVRSNMDDLDFVTEVLRDSIGEMAEKEVEEEVKKGAEQEVMAEDIMEEGELEENTEEAQEETEEEIEEAEEMEDEEEEMQEEEEEMQEDMAEDEKEMGRFMLTVCHVEFTLHHF